MRCLNYNGSYECRCNSDDLGQTWCGKHCHKENPCRLTSLCHNEGVCKASCDSPPYYKCNCPDGWEGSDCRIKSRAFGDIAMIVGPIVGGMLFIAVVGAVVFLIMARRRRRSEGKYKPATQEQTSPRLQLDNMIKPPPEERLI